jgi:hypothetical protein
VNHIECFYKVKSLERSVVISQDFPALWAHKASGRVFIVFGHVSHLCTRYEEIVFIFALRS